jgi:hypothetical protein
MAISNTEYAVNIDTDINRYLEQNGIKHALLGYRYLFAIIKIGVEDRVPLKSITDLYEKVAQTYGVEAYSIERAIRYSIKRRKMTNKEFILKAIDDLVCGVAYNG